MKKMIILLIGLTALVNCKTIDKTNVGGRETIVVQRGFMGYPTVAPFNTVFSSDIEDCVKDLKEQGVTEVTSMEGTSSTSANRKLFPFSMQASISPIEYCKAAGNK
ncbi:MAG: hypothetical protein OEV78_07485 [Spirochaetia bacterium]|nr:hypothetical protein [Spirochaetia bacterium]